MVKVLCGIVLSIILLQAAYAQNKSGQTDSVKNKKISKDTVNHRRVKGKVTSAEDNSPLEHVKISIPHTFVDANTNEQGEYIIELNSISDTLLFQLEGRKPKGLLPKGNTLVNVSLEKDTTRKSPSQVSHHYDSIKSDSTRTAVNNNATPSDTAIATTGKKITGVVTSADDNSPIPGANVAIKGTDKGAVTDVDGKYMIVLDTAASALVFSFVGMVQQEIPIENRSTIDVTLASESKVLKEVVVIGYGTMDRSTLTSSVSTIQSEALESERLPSITQAIQAKAGGVQVTQKSGSPGGGVSIRIRGTTSINASSDPLYVVDGIPVNSNTNFVGGSDFNFGGGTQGINILASINPNDVESVEILKDAAAGAIYGARAANGVVLITTKRGKANTSTISFNAYTGVSEVPSERKYKLMNTADYISYMKDYYAIKGAPVPEQILKNDVSTDWQKEIFRTAPMQSYELSASGGEDKTQYYTSVGYYNQQGVILNSGFERISARMNVDHQQSEKLKISTNLNITRAINNRVQEENSKEGSTKNGIIAPPNLSVRNADGSYQYDQLNTSRENPVAMLLLPVNKAETFRILGNISAEYQVIKGLFLKTNWGTDMSYIDEQFFMPPNGIRFVASTKGLGASRSSKDQLWINENTITFDRNLGNHHINLLGGVSVQDSRFSYTDARRTNFANNDITYISAGGTLSGAVASAQEWAISSYFSRVNYGFKNKYLLTANLRVDGSSRFGANRKYGTFPSAAAAWRISEEDFLKNNKVVNNLKLRGSWGITGNQNIPNYASYSLYSGGSNYLNQPGFTPVSFGDPNLSWETTQQTDIGFDLGLFNNRVSILADAYLKNTSDLLINIQIPHTTGYSTTYKNVGKMQNKGFEFELTTRNLIGKFQWTTSYNMTFNRNKVTALPAGDLYGGLGGSLNIARVGLPIGSFYGWKEVGVNTQTGLIDYQKRDGSVGAPSDPLDKQIIGNPNPKFFGGITNNFYYKGFDLSIVGQFVYGNKIFNYNQFTLLSANSDTNNGSVDENRRWRNPGDVTDIPRPTPGLFDNSTVSSRFIEDGSFLRIRNITIGYTFPTATLSRLRVKTFRVYASVQNAHVFTKYKGYDPEVSSSIGGANPGLEYGFDYGSYPQPRIFTGGINLTF